MALSGAQVTRVGVAGSARGRIAFTAKQEAPTGKSAAQKGRKRILGRR